MFLIIPAKSTAEIITEKLQATIALMKKQNRSEIPSVIAAIQKDLLTVYSGMARPAHKQMLGDRFNEMGGTTVIADYMKFLTNDVGLDQEGAVLCTIACFDVLLNFTHSSHNFASALGKTDALLMLLKQAEQLKTGYKSSKVNLFSFYCLLFYLFSSNDGDE